MRPNGRDGWKADVLAYLRFVKFDDLCSIAHNVADSFGSGASLLFNYGFYPYEDAQRSDDGVLEVDFLSGTAIAGLSLRKPTGRFRPATGRWTIFDPSGGEV